MSFDSIGEAFMLIYDELKNDKASKSLIKKIDSAKSDEQLKAGIVAGVKRLRELDKNALANEIEKKTKGFAF